MWITGRPPAGYNSSIGPCRLHLPKRVAGAVSALLHSTHDPSLRNGCMKTYSHRRPRPLLVVPLAVLVLGCGRDERILSYTVPKEPKQAAPPAAAAAEPPESSEPTHRMLAAILPAGDRAWFFKIVGPVAAVEKRADEVDKFFNSIRPADDGPPTWQLPADDWKEEQGSGMRVATIWIPGGDKPLEMSVIPSGGDLLSNINRWRGQMKLPEVAQEQLGQFTREIKAGDATLTIVDLRGHFQAGPGMMPPFARGAQGQPGQAPALPPGHPPINGAPDGDR